VMFERKAADGENAGVRSALRACGYALFKLIGPDSYLVPVGRDERFDTFDLNLFACKPDRAEILSAAGLLTTRVSKFKTSPGMGLNLWRRQYFAASFAGVTAAMKPRYRRALDAYALWRDESRPLPERCGALLAAADDLQGLTADTRDLAVLSTSARVAHEAGKRAMALDYLNRIFALMKQVRLDVREPFWPSAPRYDAISPGADRNNWFLAATLEACEERRAFSSQFAPPDTLAGLDWLAGTRYASPAMERRRQLVAIRTGRQRERQSSPLLSKASAAHLYPQLWGGAGGEGGIRTLDTP
jgi:hypothetical protein